MNHYLIYGYLLAVLSSISSGTDLPVRNTNFGPIMGIEVLDSGVKAHVFLGVPYAKPPVEHLRFEVPQPSDSWTEPLNCTKPPPWCVQFWYPDPRIEAREQSEDCLYMNVFVPAQSKHPSPYPVLLWIHGGSYQVNGANMFPVEGTVRNLVSKGIIIVIINYRLGPLGFLSTLNAEIHGNYGIEDQIMALKWVKENIKHFDGDPEKVTVGGESAGAASVSLLALSPRVQDMGLFRQTMIRSGSSLAPWAVRSANTDLNSLLMIRWAQCLEKNMKNVKKCLKAIPLHQIKKIWQVIGNHDLMFVISRKAQPPQNYNHPFLAHTYFTPVVDGYRMNDSIIPNYPSEMVKTNPRVPAMIGVTTGECAAYVTWLYFLVSQDGVHVDLQDLEFVVPRVVYSNPEQLKQAVYDAYINVHLTEPDFDYGKALVQIASDQNFVAPAVSEVKYYANANVSTHVYVFEHGNDELRKKHTVYGLYNVGAAHGYDMVYIFQSTSVLDPVGQALNWNQDDLIMTNYLSNIVTSYVKYGDPNRNPEESDGKIFWPEFTADCGKALMISLKPRLVDFFSTAYNFWERTVPVIQSLTLTKGYKFFQPVQPCAQTCDEENMIFYRTSFYVLLVACGLLFLALLTLCCIYRNGKTSTYTLGQLRTVEKQ